MVSVITNGLPVTNRTLSPPGASTPTRAEGPADRQSEPVADIANAAQQGVKVQESAAEEKFSAANQEPKAQELTANVEKLNALVGDIRRELRFSVHEGTDRLMIQVINSNTDEVVREIPPEAVLDLIEHLKDSTLMVSEEA